jgi:hypothetical protein
MQSRQMGMGSGNAWDKLQDMGWLMVKQSASYMESCQHRLNILETAMAIEIYFPSYCFARYPSLVKSD